MTASDVLTLRSSNSKQPFYREPVCMTKRVIVKFASFAASRSRSTSQGQGIQVEPHRGGRAAERWLLLCESPAQFEAECHDMSHQG